MTESDEDLVYYASDNAETRTWKKALLELYRGRCANCGGEDRVRPKMLVPESAGGRLVVSNGTLLCRSCEVATETTPKKVANPQRLVNFWTSNGLFDRVKAGLEGASAFPSMGALLRYLIGKYVEDPSRFDDLMLYQDEDRADVKINIWVDKELYTQFRDEVSRQGWTVTDALKGLILFYEMNTERKEIK